MRASAGSLAGKRVRHSGLAFKPKTDDMREAPARVLMEGLWAEGASVRAYDPKAMDQCREIYGERRDLTLVGSATEALEGADVPGRDHRVEGIPGPGLRRHQGGAVDAGRVRRPQSLRAGAAGPGRSRLRRFRPSGGKGGTAAVSSGNCRVTAAGRR